MLGSILGRALRGMGTLSAAHASLRSLWKGGRSDALGTTLSAPAAPRSVDLRQGLRWLGAPAPGGQQHLACRSPFRHLAAAGVASQARSSMDPLAPDDDDAADTVRGAREAQGEAAPV